MPAGTGRSCPGRAPAPRGGATAERPGWAPRPCRPRARTPPAGHVPARGRGGGEPCREQTISQAPSCVCRRPQAEVKAARPGAGSQNLWTMTISAEELRRTVRTRQYHSVVNQAAHDRATRGERLADHIASAIGSWRFLIIQTVLVLLWVAINLVGIGLRWDPYPFILLNLMVSVQAAYTGPVPLLASNRQS